MEVKDFSMLIENAFEVPYIDEAFYRGFCGGAKTKSISKIANVDPETAWKSTIGKILKDKAG